jgi:hypothetical protein
MFSRAVALEAGPHRAKRRKGQSLRHPLATAVARASQLAYEGGMWLAIFLVAIQFAAIAELRRQRRRGAAPNYPPVREEPCWTEQVAGPDGLSYGRSGCFHQNLADMDSKGAAGDFSQWA